MFGLRRKPPVVRPRLIYSRAYGFEWGQHIFPVAKYRLVAERLVRDGLAAAGDFEEPSPVTREQLLLVHGETYLDLLDNLTATPEMGIKLFEVPCSQDVLDMFRLMTGGSILAGRRAVEWGAAANLGGGFHHAFADRGEGFCLLNDIAVAIRVLQAERVIRRAAVIDVDLHQGNGTARIFQGDASVFTFSIHQENNYPAKERSTLDIGLADGTGDEEYLRRLETALPALLDGDRPELVVYQGGADPFERDRLGDLKLTKPGLRRRDEMVFAACRSRRIPILVTLGGGYADDVDDVVDIHVATIAALQDAMTK